MLNRPLKFAPYLKTVLWGGDKIAHFKGIDTDLKDIGESWEISVVSGHESVVIDNDDLAGASLNQLVEQYGADLLGTDVIRRCGASFPLLIKIIDARRDLSVQVHPDDTLAMKRHNSPGKSEMWYIIKAEPNAKIYAGLSKALTPDDYLKRIAENSIMDVVAAHDSAPGQFYFVPAGTIHAIGAGNLLAEVQQSSDITYRVYDYDRRDADGNARELHTEMAKDAIDYTFPNKVHPTAETFDATTKDVIKCDYFKADYLNMKDGDQVVVDNQGRTFAILMITSGAVTLTLADGESADCKAGDTLLLPAAMGKCVIKGTGKGLLITC